MSQKSMRSHIHILPPEALARHIAELKRLFGFSSNPAGEEFNSHFGPFLQHHLAHGITMRKLERICTDTFGSTLSRNAIIGRVHRLKLVVYNEPGSKNKPPRPRTSGRTLGRAPKVTAPARRTVSASTGLSLPKVRQRSPEERRRSNRLFLLSQKNLRHYASIYE